MMEKFFESEFGARRMEQVETGIVMEYCERTLEASFEEEDSELLFGCMESSSYVESIDEHAPNGIADQLYRMDLIQEVPPLADFLPSCCGTSVMDVEYLLGMQEGSFESLHGASLSDITEALAQDYRVLCIIRMPNTTEVDGPLSLYESGCFAEVRGIDLRSPDSAKVCLDALSSMPLSWQCSLEDFMKAWKVYDNRCYLIYRESCHEY